MRNGYDFDYIFFDENSEWPPAEMAELLDAVRELAEGIGQALSDLAAFLSGAFARSVDELAKLITNIIQDLPRKKRKIFKPIRRLEIFCLYNPSHFDLIPYYTGGFL